MRKVIVFGAAGRTGKFVVEYALEQGHEVTAFVHHNKFQDHHPKLMVVEGDVYDEQKVIESIEGHDVLISVIGTKQIDGDAVNLMSDAMRIFIKGMNQHGVKRVLAVGGMAILQLNETMQQIDKPDYTPKYRNIGIGHNKVYKLLRETSLDWTMAGCPDIIDAPKTGKFHVKKDYMPEGIFRINTGDLADFLVKEMENNQFLRTRVGICNF